MQSGTRSLLDLSQLPDLPQTPFLKELAEDLWQDPQVVALWLGGSLARGVGDRDSDVDLRVALAPGTFDRVRLPASAHRLQENAVAMLRFPFSDHQTLFHALLGDGQLYDLLLMAAEENPGQETRLILGCREESLRLRLAQGADPVTHFSPADPHEVRELLLSFWINQRKHIKVLRRDLPLMAWEGEHRLRQDLLRFWFIAATGNDCGPISRATIHTFSPVVETLKTYHTQKGGDLLSFIGVALESEEAILSATFSLRAEVARVGRELAVNLGFPYPEAAEATVNACWQEYLSEGGNSRGNPGAA